MPILVPKDLQDQGDVHSFKTTTAGARYGNGGNSFCVAGCRTTPWYGVARMASTLRCMNARNSRLRPCFAEKAQIVTKKYTTTNRRLCPVEFFAVCVALVTTTRGSSQCRPDDKAEATSRLVALCGAKQEPQGFVAEPESPATTRAHSYGYQI